MTSTQHNCRLLADWMEEKFGKDEFNANQIGANIKDLFGYSDPQTHKRYIEEAVHYEQIEQTESGNFIATPKHILTPRQKLARLKGQKTIK